ncbi:unnamed protein product [Blepharisma stoltei]|uniref:Phosphodiesterase n=1 Tax=Blepharisma stoltei TaxID=1481888 RepID=A0AAU9JSZ0_9CILI|nr:unnamed protein product [Blepharisma stoltei]
MKLTPVNCIMFLSTVTSFIIHGIISTNFEKLALFVLISKLPKRPALYISIFGSMIITLITNFPEDLLFLSALIYIFPQILKLRLSSAVNCFIWLSIIWLIFAGYFKSGQFELLTIIWTSIISSLEISKQTKFDEILKEKEELAKKCKRLETEVSIIEASQRTPSAKRTSELINKLKHLSNTFMQGDTPGSSMRSSRFGNESLTFSSYLYSHRNIYTDETESSDFITNDEIKEIIASLISQDYLFWNPEKGHVTDLNLLEIGKNQMNLYTQTDDSVPESPSRRRKLSNPLLVKRLTTMKTSCIDNKSLFETLNELGRWDFDQFKLLELTKNPTFEVGRYIFDFLDFMGIFDIDEHKLDRFLTVVENGYKKENYYHNSLHAADVAASAMFLIQQGLELGNGLEDIDNLAMIIAALCHDIEHPGVNNPYLVISQDSLAFKYNDQSVLEHMHANRTFQILSEDKTNILANLAKVDYQRFRKITIQAILGTDLQVHFDKLADFKSMISKRLNFSDDKFKLLSLQMCIKCADIGHGAKTLDLHKKWSNLITKEFFKQGDLERRRGFPVTPLCDRESVVLSKSQEGFLKVLVRPLFELWEEFLELHAAEENKDIAIYTFEACLSNIRCNIEYWDNEYILYKDWKQTFFLDDLPPPMLKKHSTQIPNGIN